MAGSPERAEHLGSPLLCLAELDWANDLSFEASDHSSVKRGGWTRTEVSEPSIIIIIIIIIALELVLQIKTNWATSLPTIY